ncbi:MAG TPA: hypothetical protein VMB48_17555 [Steroidobacteraceae bacterium]|nr:hypothetical protein [Steroidobacteraceae bacterium]
MNSFFVIHRPYPNGPPVYRRRLGVKRWVLAMLASEDDLLRLRVVPLPLSGA